jgi:hypothetical protein
MYSGCQSQKGPVKSFRTRRQIDVLETATLLSRAGAVTNDPFLRDPERDSYLHKTTEPSIGQASLGPWPSILPSFQSLGEGK